MNTFRSIDELVKMFEREKVLLKEMFYKRKQLSVRYDYALELTEYKEERIRFLIEYGVLRESGDFLEMEDLYLKFFEEVLQINEEINVSFVQDYLNHLNDNIDYFLNEIMDEDHMQDIYDYFRESSTDKLEDAIEELGDDYTEDEIRLVRIKFISEMAN